MTYPFSAIVSVEDLKLALILNAINPKIGGLLIRGSKGSGKTTAVRALAQILPNIRTIKGCPFNCSLDDPSNVCEVCQRTNQNEGSPEFEEKKMRVIELPLGATEDRVIGSLDVEKAIKKGVQALEPGILAEANQNILYVDEINLLPDHIADDLLDAAATGWNIVEREGISVKHPSRFILIGTMNPEEGQLRPQLLDRLPLSAEASRISDPKDRIEVVKRNMDFEANPEEFIKKYDAEQEDLRRRILRARKILPEVSIPDKLIQIVCDVCLELKVDGMRPDIVIAKTARTLAAFEDKNQVTPDHILKSAEFALNHRTREGGFLEPATPREIREAFFAKLEESKSAQNEGGRTIDKIKGAKEKEDKPLQEEKRKIFPPFGFRKSSKMEKELGKAKKVEGHTPQSFAIKDSDLRRGDFSFDSAPVKGGSSANFNEKSEWSEPDITRGAPFIDGIRKSRFPGFNFTFRTKKASKHVATIVGKRAEAFTATHRGRARGWKIPSGKLVDIHFPATIRNAARKQRFRDKPLDTALAIRKEDVREKVRIYRAPMTIVFVLDLSESMLHNVDDVKEVMLKLHNDAYRYRDKVGIVTFKEMGAVVAQHPTSNLKLVANKLQRLRMSGLTPLAAGMQKALEVLRQARRRDMSTIPVMVMITDGDANVPLKRDLQTGEFREFDALDSAFYKYDNEAIKDVLSISESIRKESIFTVTINTMPIPSGSPSGSGTATAQMIASITGGTYYETSMGMISQEEPFTGEISEAIHQAEKSISNFPYLSARAHLTKQIRMNG